jgi:hypothetical protein
MQLDRNDKQLLEILNRAIREMEKVEDDPATMNFVARRVGNIVKHMKDLRDDLRPRGGHNGHNGSTEKHYDTLRTSASPAISVS